MECGCTFTDPDHRRDGFGHEFGTHWFLVPICPECSSEIIEECAECSNRCECTNPKKKEDYLCEDCKIELKEMFKGFLATLSEQEIEQLDEWLDGTSVKEVDKWKTD